jgi:hypothetical protein
MPLIDYAPSSQCPVCATAIRHKQLGWGRSFRCPSCGCSLRISFFYRLRIALASGVLVGLVSYALGARQLVWTLACLLGLFPVVVLVTALAMLFDAPKLKLSDDYSLDLNKRGGP